MSPGNFARLEADRHDPRLATLRRVAEALGTTVRDLL
jgi:transcriptional regulator with XRE-family HTH domain